MRMSCVFVCPQVLSRVVMTQKIETARQLSARNTGKTTSNVVAVNGWPTPLMLTGYRLVELEVHGRVVQAGVYRHGGDV